jgi:hypothetical protein
MIDSEIEFLPVFIALRSPEALERSDARNGGGSKSDEDIQK